MKAIRLLLILLASQISWSSPGFHSLTQESSPSSIQGAGQTSDGELSLKISTSWEEFSPLYFSLPLLEGLFSEGSNGLPQESLALQNDVKGKLKGLIFVIGEEQTTPALALKDWASQNLASLNASRPLSNSASFEELYVAWVQETQINLESLVN